MGLQSEHYNQAKEEINKALIQEYILRNPGVREQDVIMMNQDGKLIFSDLSSVLAEMKTRKDFDASVIHTEKMTASLAVQENQRWQECYDSATQSKLMVDCLNSSPFNLFDQNQWAEEHEYLRRKESASAKATVKIEEQKLEILKFRNEKVSIHSSRGRTTIISYLQWVIQQLRVLHQLLKKEIGYSELFETSASQFIEVNLASLKNEPEPFSILNKIFQTLSGNQAPAIQFGDVSDLNRQVLIETKKTLTSAVDKLSKKVTDKRKAFQIIWTSITALTETVKGLEELNRLDADEKAAIQESINAKPLTRRMARFGQSRKR
ncbi:MAG: hypothetical protein P9L94_20130 [Candidatus Hinthialibacter antarcticus]|nr:hypothetical protein [Candidatus Hinthialibacter antarcticus]